MSLSWLKKAGQVLLKAEEMVVGFGPMAGAIYPQAAPVIQTVSADLQDIEKIVVQAEAMGQALGLPGAQKIKAAGPIVAQIVLSRLVAGRKVKDQAAFAAACERLGGDIADVLNALDGDPTA